MPVVQLEFKAPSPSTKRDIPKSHTLTIFSGVNCAIGDREGGSGNRVRYTHTHTRAQASVPAYWRA